MTAGYAGGYIIDTPYVPTVSQVQTPAHLALVAAMAGVRWVPDRDALTVIDLGCGLGQSVCAMAAANPGWTVVGIDFAPGHIAEAREVAAAAGLENARFLELDLATLDDAAAARLLPEADVISLHGVWTWVSDAVRQGVLAVLRARLKPGGMAAVSYNAMPGWANDLALGRLIHSLAGVLDGTGEQRAARALEIVLGLHAAGAPTLAASFMLKRFSRPGASPPADFARYVAHEFLTDHWRPAYATDVHAAMAGAKLDFIGSAALARQFPGLFLTEPQRAAIAALPPRADRELVEDCFNRPTLRQDVFMRGRRAADAKSMVAAIRLCLCRRPADGRITLGVPVGEAELPAPVANAVLDALTEAPRTVGELLSLPALATTEAGELVMMLVGESVAMPLWRGPPSPGPLRERARRFNQVALARYGPWASGGRRQLALAAPALGAGLPSDPPELALALALEEAGGADRPDVPALARSLLVSDPTPEALTWAEARVATILAERLDAWRALGVVQSSG